MISMKHRMTGWPIWAMPVAYVSPCNAAMRARLADQGFEPVGSSPGEFGAYIKSEIAKWGKAIRDAGIRPE